MSDPPTVCIAHGAFIPCRKVGEHRYTPNPFWVKSVRDYHSSPITGLTWEPAWPRRPVTYDLCFDRNPNNHGITCTLPNGHASPHAMGDGATWPTTDEGTTHD